MAVIDSMVWISKKESPFSLSELKKKLTVIPKPRTTLAQEEDEDGFLEWVRRTEEVSEPVKCYCFKEIEGEKHIGLPIDWAFCNIPNLPSLLEGGDRTVRGERIEVAKLPDPTHKNAPEGQSDFFLDTNHETRFNYSCFVQAGTGNGKTVAALNAIGHAKRTALAIVPNITLAHQWREEAYKHLGLEPDEIGLVGDGHCRWEGTKVTVAVINSIVQKNLGPAFYRYFGFVVWDEAHRLGAFEFSKSMSLFPARFKLALSATPERPDGMSNVFFNYFGKPAVIAETPPLPVTCWQIDFPLIGKLDWMNRCRSDARPMKWLAGLEKRNEMLANLIYDLWKRGRNIIVLSKFIAHLETLHAMCKEKGIPLSDMGSYTGSWKGKKLGQGYLDKVKAEAKIQFATYSKAKEGYDCPRLDAGIEATPVSNNIQGIGRVRRKFPCKKKALWFTICDGNVMLFKRYSKSRLGGYRKNNVTIKKLSGTKIT